MPKPDLHAVSSELPDPPYPATAQAGTFQFDVDVTRLLASDTWILVGDEVFPWCVMTWLVSWSLVPCGSLPNNDDVICARIRCSRRFYDDHRAEILRGWKPHNDGRLYHPVVTEKVLAFLGKRSKWAEKKRQRSPKKSPWSPGGVSGDSHETLDGVPGGSLPSSSSSSSCSSSVEDREGKRVEGAQRGERAAKTAETGAKPKRPVARAARLALHDLPSDWKSWTNANTPHLDADATWAMFADYWAGVGGQKGCKLDWFATWRNWCRREDKSQGNHHEAHKRSRRQSVGAEFIDRKLEEHFGAKTERKVDGYVVRDDESDLRSSLDIAVGDGGGVAKRSG